MHRKYFNWDNDFVTGVDVIDEQHRGLIEIINEVLQLGFNNIKISESEIRTIYNKLTQYVIEHFGTEEQLMKDVLIDERHSKFHFKAHEEFKEAVGTLFSDFSVLVIPGKLNEVSEFLIRWLAYHILNMDKSLVRQLDHIHKKGMSPEDAFEEEDNFMEASTEPLLKALKGLFFLVSEKNKALTLANSELEEKVRSRTSELIDANAKLERISMHDVLTGLPNRRYAMDEIEKLFNNWKRYGTTFSLLFIDVDKFKAVNDNYGHEYGDEVLKWIADFLKTNLRKSDVACRLGGDEFLVICSHCDGRSAFKLGEKLSELCKTYNLKALNNSWEPSLSIGVSEIDNVCESTNDILKKADTAMYMSKKNGGGHAVLS